MPSTVGPLVAMSVQAYRDPLFEEGEFSASNDFLVEEEGGRIWSLLIYSASLREKLKHQKMRVFVAQILREDGESLLAFSNMTERLLFLELLKIDSMGPKTAAHVVAALDARFLREMLQTGKAPLGLKITGLGPKTLEKLAQGLKSNSEKFLKILGNAETHNEARNLHSGVIQKLSLTQSLVPPDILKALERFGLPASESREIYEEIFKEEAQAADLDSAELIKKIFQRWGKRRNHSKETHS